MRNDGIARAAQALAPRVALSVYMNKYNPNVFNDPNHQLIA
jgi:hypothetical protein